MSTSIEYASRKGCPKAGFVPSLPVWLLLGATMLVQTFPSLPDQSNQPQKIKIAEALCRVQIDLGIKTGVPDPRFYLENPAEIEEFFSALNRSFPLPYLGEENDVVKPIFPDIYSLYLEFSGCPKAPDSVVFWRGLIIVSHRLEDGETWKYTYFADTEGLESRLIEKGWRGGFFSDWDISDVPPNLRPLGWKEPEKIILDSMD